MTPTAGGAQAPTPSRRVVSPGRLLPIAYEIVAAVVVLWTSSAFATSYGYNFGYDNHTTYLVGALRLYDPGALSRDWLASDCTPYHPIFSYLAWALWAIDEDGWGFAYANVVTVTAMGGALYGLCRAFAGRLLALPSHLVVLAIAMQTRTHSAGVSYIADIVFQPSTLGGLGWLAGMAAFVARRWFLSGLCFGLGGLFHANYLVLGFPVLGLAHLLIEDPRDLRGLARRLALQLGPSVLALLVLSPLIFGAASHPDAARAREIFQTIRSPHHYLPSGYRGRFLGLAGWQLLGLGAAWPLLSGRKGPGPRLGALLVGLGVLVWSGTFLTTWVFLPSVSQLFPWRAAPYSDLVAQVALVGGLLGLIIDPARLRAHSRLTPLLVLGGLVLVCLDRPASDQPWLGRLLLLLLTTGLLTAGVGLAVATLARATARGRRHLEPASFGGPWPPVPGGPLRPWAPHTLVAPLLLTALALGLWTSATSGQRDPARIERASSLIRGFDAREENLYAWIREHTDRDSRFLQPPLMERFRITARRAIVVDWKSPPILPGELLEWYERLGTVAGRPGFQTAREVATGYDAMDSARLRALRARYAIDYAVVRKGRERVLKDWPVAYANPGFAVLDLRGSHP